MDQAAGSSAGGSVSEFAGQLELALQLGPAPQPKAKGSPHSGAIRVLRGVRDTEAGLLEEIDAAIAARSCVTPALRIVVPSGSLRDHVARALLRHRGKSLLGVTIQTHFALALETLERIGEAPQPGQSLSALLTQRLVRENVALRNALGGFLNGWQALRASLRDLLDAGFRPAHLEAALECLGDRTTGAPQKQPIAPADARCAALLRGAASIAERLEEQRRVDSALLLERATAALWSRGRALLPSAGLWVYGVADATGALADWIEALLAVHEGRILVNQPPDPARPGVAEARYSEDFLARLEARGLPREIQPPVSLSEQGEVKNAAGVSSLRLVCAETPAAESGEIAARVRVLLENGTPAEDIAICARGFEEYRAPLIAALDAWAIPYSSQGLASSGDAVSRHLNRFARFLQEGANLDLDAWVAMDPLLSSDVRTALHHLGLLRLGDLCAADSDAGFQGRDGLALPVRRSLDTARRIDRTIFLDGRTRAQKALRWLAGWPASAPAARYQERLEMWLRTFGWRDRDGSLRAAAERLSELAAGLPDDFAVERDEWQSWLKESVQAQQGPEPGGNGSGVQVLSVVAARERQFEHLFLLGLGREGFPRPVADDPLFPEAQRARLRAVLPDLPLKRRGHEEERHLFASLLGGADHVTLSRSAFSAVGREWPESPLLLRLRLADPSLCEELPSTHSTEWTLPVESAAANAALRNDRGALATLLPEVLATRRSESTGAGMDLRAAPADQIAGALRAVWRELELPQHEASELPLGPFFGWVGNQEGDAREPFITAIADLLRCPWQRFLRRELRLAPPPDAGARLPSPDARVRGGTLHRVLERVAEAAHAARPSLEVESGAPRDLEGRLQGGALPLCWPEATRLEDWIREASCEAAEREGIRGDLYPRLLARSLAPALARARELDEARSVRVFGGELEGVAVLPGDATRRIRFRADRVELGESGPVLVEYKSGRCFVDLVRERSRVRRLGQVLRHGEGIQAPAYLYAPGAAASRLVFIGPSPTADRRETTLEAASREALVPFEESAGLALEALERGLRPPRLVATDGRGEGEACNFCEMRVACLQGDSAQQGRLRTRAARARDGADAESLHLLFHGTGAEG